MKSFLKIWVLLSMFVVIVVSCINDADKIIVEQVVTDDAGIYHYVKSGDNVTGILENRISFGDRLIIRHIKIRNGIPITLIDYDLSKEQIGKCILVDGKINGNYEGNDNNYVFVCPMIDGALDGVCKTYNDAGLQVKESVYSNGTMIKSYDFDDKGLKIVPLEECLELEAYRTGYFEYIDYSYNKILYCPIVILKFKNISGKPFDIDTELIFTFIENGEIISTTTTNLYYHYGSTPIPVNVSKQCHSMSDVGKVSTYGVNVADIRCEIQMNGKPFKTLKIANKILYSNRI